MRRSLAFLTLCLATLAAGAIPFSFWFSRPGAPSDDLSDLYFRARSTDLSQADNSAVATWPDTINTNNLVSGADAVFKTTILNGNAVVRFDGTAYLSAPLALAEPYHVFIVCRFLNSPGGSFETVFDGDSYNTSRIYRDTFGDLITDPGGMTLSTVTTNWQVLEYCCDSASSFISDGVSTVTGDTGAIAELQVFNLASTLGVDLAAIDVAEIRIYNTNKTATRAVIRSAVSSAWGL